MQRILYLSLALNLLAIILGAYTVHKLGGLQMLKYRFQNRGLALMYKNQKDQIAHLPTQTHTSVFIGDSHISYGQWSAWLKDGTVINMGINGDHSRGVFERIDEIARYEPDFIVIQVGINDLLYGTDPEVVTDWVAQSLDAISTTLPASQIILCSVFPIDAKLLGTKLNNADIQVLNQSYKALALASGITFLDIYTDFLDETYSLDRKYSFDGIHLNGEGYDIWSNKLHRLLNNDI